MDLVLATRNPNKVREFEQLLGSEFNIFDLSSFSNAKIGEETGSTFAENAILKAVSLSKNRQLFVVADDSGLEVDALSGGPGIYSARYAGEKATDSENINKLASELRSQNIADEKRSARFRCVIALARKGEILRTFEGVVEGKIVDPPRGRSGFGYDPVFQPTGFNQTFAEMSAELKNKISHRGRAIAALRVALREIEN
jgi:XTP/dITP diphosphohydrolase